MEERPKAEAESNRERRRHRGDADASESESRQRLRAVFDALQEPLSVVDLELTITDLNQETLDVFGVADRESALGRKCFEVFKHREEPCPSCGVMETYRTGSPARRVSSPAGQTAPGGKVYEVFAYPIIDADARILGAVEYARDITPRMAMERALRESEHRFRELAKTVNEVVWSTSLDGAQQLYMNPTAERVYGRACKEFFDDPGLWLEVIHPEDRERVAGSAELLLLQGHREVEYRVVRPDGEVRWLLDRARVILDKDGKASAVGGIATDITGQKKAECKLAAEQRLLRELLRLHERDRKLLSCDIHDGFLQDIIGAQLFLDAGCAALRSQDHAIPEQFDNVRQHLGRALAEARNMMGELRPPVIDECGIVEAIKYLAAQNREAGELEVVFQHDVHYERLDSMLEGIVFRIVQEALNNSRRHSRVETAEVRLTQEGGLLKLRIQDQGIGFDPADVPQNRFGIRGIVERARLFGGRATVDSSPGNGTCITVELPIRYRGEEPENAKTG